MSIYCRIFYTIELLHKHYVIQDDAGQSLRITSAVQYKYNAASTKNSGPVAVSTLSYKRHIYYKCVSFSHLLKVQHCSTAVIKCGAHLRFHCKGEYADHNTVSRHQVFTYLTKITSHIHWFQQQTNSPHHLSSSVLNACKDCRSANPDDS